MAIMAYEEISVEINAPVHRYTIYVGTGFLENDALIEACRKLNRRIAIIADETVMGRYSEDFCHRLKACNIDYSLFPFPLGEVSKSREVKASIEDAMAAKAFTRDSAILAIGGGVCCDLAGFIAATYCRGLPLLLVPTTLLAMVDAAIGGKTAVNHPSAKNFIGALYHPSAIYIDVEMLKTLDANQRRHGLAEMVKHGLIASEEHYRHLETHTPAYIEGRETISEEMIAESLRIKLANVIADPAESGGRRRILNFGHTFAHAFEQVSNYTIAHGDAVWSGMLLESYCAWALGSLSEGDFQRISAFLLPYSRAVNLSSFCREKLWQAMVADKKSRYNLPRLVLLKAIGQTDTCEGEWCTSLPHSVFLQALEEIDALRCHSRSHVYRS